MEASLGLVQNGQAPAVMAAYHVFIRDRDAFDFAKNAFTEVSKDVSKFAQNATLMFVDMRVKGIV